MHVQGKLLLILDLDHAALRGGMERNEMNLFDLFVSDVEMGIVLCTQLFAAVQSVCHIHAHRYR
jgi:hypothetical protein